MPSKDAEERKRLSRESMRKKRQGLTSEGLTSEGLTGQKEPQMLTRPNRLGDNGSPEMVANGYNPDELLSDGRKRYLGPFSDGQVLDRMTVNSACPGNVGSNAGQHPFYGLNSIVGEPSQGKRLNVTYGNSG